MRQAQLAAHVALDLVPNLTKVRAASPLEAVERFSHRDAILAGIAGSHKARREPIRLAFRQA